jgi:diguanylate cyclase (GGDEF)-like protein/PAS domain S-box-containing protein
MSENQVNIILIEEDQKTASFITKTLREADELSNYVVTHTELFSAGLAMLNDRESQIILLGLSLPDGLGVDNFVRIRNSTPNAPIVVLSDMDDKSQALECVRLGAQDYLIKQEITNDALLKAIQYAIERKSVETALKGTELSLRTIIENNADAILIVDMEGLIQFANPAAEELFGKSENELVGSPFGFPIESGETEIEIPRSGRRPERVVVEMRNVGTDWTGDRVILSSMRDITRHKRAEEAVRKSEEQLSAFMESATDAFLLLDSDMNILVANKMYRTRILESQGDPVGMNLVDLYPHLKRSERYLKYKEVIKTGAPFNTDEVIAHPEFGDLHVDLRAFKVGDGMGIIFTDITERVHAEREQRLAATVFETAIEGILITDSDANIITVNQAFTLITGYTMDEMIGQNPRLLSSGLHDDEFYKNMWETLVRPGHWQGEIWNRRKNGELFAEWLRISAVKNDLDEVTNFVGIFSDITAQVYAEHSLLYMATHDSLTNLPNRELFYDRLDHTIAQAKRYKRQVGVLFLDLDGFKVVNDTYGHDTGDVLLQLLSARLKDSLRESDTIARLGGDEFTVIIEPINTLQDAALVADKIITTVHKPFTIKSNTIQVSGSLGISIYPNHGEEAKTLVKKADDAMYRAKEKRNCYTFYQADDNGR